MTLGEWIPQYLTSYKLNTIKVNSYSLLWLIVEHIPQELKDMELPDILPMHLQRFYNEFAQTYSKSYMDKTNVLMKSLFTAAIDNGFCTRNPTANLKVPYIAEPTRENFTMEEVAIILRFASVYDPQRVGVAIMTLLLTGLRRSELLGLKRSDITDDSLTINRTIYLENNKLCVAENAAKTVKSLRTVPLTPELAYRLQTLPHKGEFLFSTRSGTPMHPRNFNRDYDAFFARLQDAEPFVRRLSPHCCRHTFATLARESGADIRVLQELLGHTNIKTTARYSHASMGSMRDAIQGLRVSINDHLRQ